MRKLLLAIVMAAALAVGMAQQDSGAETQPETTTQETQPTEAAQTGQTVGDTVADRIQGTEDFTTLRDAFRADPQLQQQLSGQGLYTVFAPTDQAFESLTPQERDRIARGEAGVSHYVVRGNLTQDVLRSMLQANQGELYLPTVGGEAIRFSLDDQDNIVVGENAQLGETIAAGNGVVYRLDQVVSATDAQQAQQAQGETITDALQQRQEYETMRSAIEANPQLSQTLSQPGLYTVFVPTNEAFTGVSQDQMEAIRTGQANIDHYVVEGIVTPETLRSMLEQRGGQMNLQLRSGDFLPLTLDPAGNVTIAGQAQLGEPQIVGNGVIVPVDQVVSEQAVIPSTEVAGAPSGPGEVAGGGLGQQAHQDLLSAVRETQRLLDTEDFEGAGQELDRTLRNLDATLQRQAEGATQQQLQQVQIALEQARQSLDADDAEGARAQLDRALESLEQIQPGADGGAQSPAAPGDEPAGDSETDPQTPGDDMNGNGNGEGDEGQ